MVEANTSYMKYIKGKINFYNMIRGSTSSSTLAALYRMLYLKNNYCLYNDDKILYITKDNDYLKKVKQAYEKLKDEFEQDYITLLSMATEKIDFFAIDDLILNNFKEIKGSSSSIKLINNIEKNNLIKVSIDNVKNEYKKLKIFRDDDSCFFYDEVTWIKSFGYSNIEDYQGCDRKGRCYKNGEGPSRIPKNSKAREAIFKIFTSYEDKLIENNLMDYENLCSIVLENIKDKGVNKYTHIFADGCETFTKKQLSIINNLSNVKTYSETNYIYNNDLVLPKGAFLVKANKISDIIGEKKVKNFNFRKPFESPILEFLEIEEEKQEVENNVAVEENNKTKEFDSSIEKFKYINLKNGGQFSFIRDMNKKDTVFLTDDKNAEEITLEEMRELPVFSNIAAGEPIFMNPDIEDNFYIPEFWIRGMEKHFILKVKGDSMIGAEIDDGDYVVIKSIQSAQNRDIVAVDIDGRATLKRLIVKGRSAVLMPENEKYEPIPILDEGAHILGVAVGILKKN